MKRSTTVFFLVFWWVGAQLLGAWHPLSETERAQLISQLESADLDSTDLCFERDWDLSTKFKTSYQIAMLNNPWYAMQELGNYRQICAADSIGKDTISLASALLKIAWDREPNTQNIYHRAKVDYEVRLSKNKIAPKALFGFVDKVYDDAKVQLDIAFGALNQADRDSLYLFLLSSWSESSDSLKYKEFFTRKGLKPKPDYELMEYAKLLAKIDLDAMSKAYATMQAANDVILSANERIVAPKTAIYHNSKHGLMILGGKGNDFYDGSAKSLRGKRVCFVYEPDGNDTYQIALHADLQNPLFMFIDITGEDVYRQAELATQFSAIMGLCLSADLGGKDSYLGDDFSFASLAGINIHVDSEGDDTYSGGLFAQGAAMFGLCLLIDQTGSDSYRATSFAQGVGGTMAVGALLDHSGDDVYYIGGRYYHAPLMPNDYRSMGQGMGFGFRPDYAGGLGLLYDAKGNDKYLGGVYAQGVAYWYAGGVLIDEAGNDVYNAIYYPQGSGIHLAYGMLFDGEGDDSYYTRNGPGQGAGHDWSLGMLFDKAGNDHYSIPGGNGLGLNNSVGIFVDSSGDDRYERRDASSLGFANLSRGTGGIGLFLDAGGKDSYPDSLQADNKKWQRGTYGSGADLELNIISKTKIEAMAETQSAEVDSLAPIKEIFAIASEWEVGSAVQRVRKARTIMLFRADEAAEYVIGHKMKSKSGLEYRAMEELVRKSELFKTKLFAVLDSEDSLSVKNAMSLISATGDSLLLDFVSNLLQQRKYVPSALGVLANIKSVRSIELLAPFMQHSSERYRYIAARSLVNLKLAAAEPVLEKHKDDKSFIVRTLIRNRTKQ